MTEEGKPYIPMNSTAKLVVEDEEERIEHQKRLDLVELEITKIQTLPAGYWPDEWRKHLGRLSTCGVALLRLMKDEEQAHAFDKRAYEAVDAIEKVFRDIETATFTITKAPRAMRQDTGDKKPPKGD
jgi:hypothetical protein